MFNLSKFKVSVDFYLSSGQILTLRFEEFSAQKGSAGQATGWNFKNPEHPWSLDIDKTTAVVIKKI